MIQVTIVKSIIHTHTEGSILGGIKELEACALGNGREHPRAFLVHEGTRFRHLSIFRSLHCNKDGTKSAGSK